MPNRSLFKTRHFYGLERPKGNPTKGMSLLSRGGGGHFVHDSDCRVPWTVHPVQIAIAREITCALLLTFLCEFIKYIGFENNTELRLRT